MNSQTQPGVAALQMSSGKDLNDNLAQAKALLEDAARAKAVLAVLPENFAIMGRHESDKLALAEADGDGPIQQFLGSQAARLGLYVLGGTVPLAVAGDAGRVHPASLLYGSDGKRLARYDKMHLFDVEFAREGGVERYHESATIKAGEVRTVVADTPAGRVGLTICYDLRFPELYRRLARPAPQAGAEIILVPSAFTQRTGEAHWEVLLRARAIENQCFIVAPNQHGEHPGGRKTYGHSMIVDPWGQILAQRESGNGVVTATLNREHLHSLRRSFPVLTHRRIDL